MFNLFNKQRMEQKHTFFQICSLFNIKISLQVTCITNHSFLQSMDLKSGKFNY